ncbi:hypothetical protein UG55_1007207 [Frankia sp. EI5c]|nr:hypothetical protein UG55_1007207 [Frankia sp. EI5c]
MPVVLVGGMLTVAFMLPNDRLYLLGPMIAVAMMITMVTTIALLPRLLQRRMSEMFGPGAGRPGWRGAWPPVSAGGRRGRPGGGFPSDVFAGSRGAWGPSAARGRFGDAHEPWRGDYGWSPYGGEHGNPSWCGGHSGHSGSDPWGGGPSHGYRDHHGSDSYSNCGSDSSWSSGGSDSSSSGGSDSSWSSGGSDSSSSGGSDSSWSSGGSDSSSSGGSDSSGW